MQKKYATAKKKKKKKRKKEMIPLTYEENDSHKTENVCHICKK